MQIRPSTSVLQIYIRGARACTSSRYFRCASQTEVVPPTCDSLVWCTKDMIAESAEFSISYIYIGTTETAVSLCDGMRRSILGTVES